MVRSASQTVEERDARELEALAEWDRGSRPDGWKLSPLAVEAYLLGTEAPIGGVPVSPKLATDPSAVQVAIASLAGGRPLLAEGPEDSGACLLGELLAAAISGKSGHMLRPGPVDLGPMRAAVEDGALLRIHALDRLHLDARSALLDLLTEGHLPGLAVSPCSGFGVVACVRPGGGRALPTALRRRFNVVSLPLVTERETRVHAMPRAVCELRADWPDGAAPPAVLAHRLASYFDSVQDDLAADSPSWLRSIAGSPEAARAFRTLLGAGRKGR